MVGNSPRTKSVKGVPTPHTSNMYSGVTAGSDAKNPLDARHRAAERLRR